MPNMGQDDHVKTRTHRINSILQYNFRISNQFEGGRQDGKRRRDLDLSGPPNLPR